MIPGQGDKIPHASWPKNQNINNRSNVVTNSIHTLKMVHIKKKKALQRKKQTRIQRMGRQEGRDDLSDESLQLAGGGGRWTGRTEAKAWVEKEQGL